MPRFINPDLTFDRAAIMRAAWAAARYRVKAAAKPASPYRAPRITTARAELPMALREAWDDAKRERGYAVWNAEREAGATAETARRAALPPRDLQIEDAKIALMFAEHNDTNSGHLYVAAARARLASLQQAA